MTVTYGGRVPNGSTFGCFWKVLGIWRGSVYKLVWRELVAYLCIYYSINIIYRYALTESQQDIFAKIKMYFSQQSETIPMSFVLGFYVSLVVSRWWDQYKLLPWPDTLALFLNAGIPGANEKHRLMRRNIVRYAILAYVITLQRVSLRVKKRFPTWQHVVDSGLLMESEKKIFENLDQKTPMSKYWMPLVWATNIINRARKESIITSDHLVQTLLMELSDIRRRLGSLIGYDTVNVPLVYTQVVSLALYTYFIAALLGRQFIPHKEEILLDKWEKPDVYFPVFTALQFCFYVGWLKVAEVLINPFGEDDDDIELNWLIDRHIKAAYMIVDEMHEEHPELLKDQFWDEVVPRDLPYTLASEHYRRGEPKCSADSYKPKAQDATYANLVDPKKSLLHEDMYADYESVDTPIVERRKSSNWFSRQLSKTGMGSIRSASTAYSSGGLFTRHRGNSVYANPENGQLPGLPLAQKMSIYDRWVGRRSGQHKNIKTASKLAGPANMQVRNRPRIPTPDVTKEVLDRENKIAASFPSAQNHIPTELTLMSHHLPTGYTYPSGDVPVVQVVLAPIQELDGTGSVNNTLHPNQPSTAALAQAVLSSSLGPVLTTPVSVPMTVSQLTSLGLTSHHSSPMLARAFDQQSIRNPTFIQAFDDRLTPTTQPLTLTEINPDPQMSSSRSNGSLSSEVSSSKASTLTISLASRQARQSPEEQNLEAGISELPNSIEGSNSLAAITSTRNVPSELVLSKSLTSDIERKISTSDPPPLTPNTSAPSSLGSVSISDGSRIRKVSVISQAASNGSIPKREVYV